MAKAGPSSRVPALLAAAPLLVIAAVLLRGALDPSSPPAGGARAPVPAPLAGFVAPQADLPADRLHERVNGAEEYLRSQGCSRLLAWDLADPKGTLEVFLFDDPAGAARVLARDVGPGRTAGPGDEASADPQSVLFRRGKAYVRLLADPDEPADPARLLAEALRADRAILDGMGRGM